MITRAQAGFAAVALILAPGLSSARANMDRFSVNVQYRGSVKKSFSGIGEGVLQYVTGAEREFRVKGRSTVSHPQKDETYEIELDMAFKLQGDTVQYLENLNDSNNEGKPLLNRIERILPFVYLAKNLPLPIGAKADRSFKTPKGEIRMHWARTKEGYEVTASEKGDVIGKFFISGTSGNPPFDLEKFRIPGKDNIMVSFVISP